jgi:hypothetical protein
MQNPTMKKSEPDDAVLDRIMQQQQAARDADDVEHHEFEMEIERELAKEERKTETQ